MVSSVFSRNVENYGHISTQPDLTHLLLSIKFINSCNLWMSVKRILHYLCQTISHGFLPRHYSSFHFICKPTRAGWAGYSDDHRSQGVVSICFSSNPISWSSHKQNAVSRPSRDFENQSLACCATAELSWI